MRFPDLPMPDYPFVVEHEDNSISSRFEDGTVQSRLKFTRSRSTYILKWTGMKSKDYFVLDDFIKNKCRFKAKVFEWVNPTDNKQRTVRLVEVRNAEMTFLDRWNVEIKLQEV